MDPINDFPSHYRSVIDYLKRHNLALIEYIEALEEQCSVQQVEAAQAAVRKKEGQP